MYNKTDYHILLVSDNIRLTVIIYQNYNTYIIH